VCVIEEKRKESCLVRSGVMRHVGWCGVVDGRRRRKRQNTLTKTKKERGTRESMKHQH
jgi:hypothetical protein